MSQQTEAARTLTDLRRLGEDVVSELEKSSATAERELSFITESCRVLQANEHSTRDLKNLPQLLTHNRDLLRWRLNEAQALLAQFKEYITGILCRSCNGTGETPYQTYGYTRFRNCDQCAGAGIRE